MIIDYDRKHFGYKFLINYNCVHCSMFKQFWPKNVFSVCNFSRAVIPRGTVSTPPVFWQSAGKVLQIQWKITNSQNFRLRRAIPTRHRYIFLTLNGFEHCNWLLSGLLNNIMSPFLLNPTRSSAPGPVSTKCLCHSQLSTFPCWFTAQTFQYDSNAVYLLIFMLCILYII